MINKKYKSILQGILLLLIVAFAVLKFALPGGRGPVDTCAWTERVPVDELVYVAHARCRMACRDIDQALVQDVYLHGEINCRKNSMSNGHHRYALEKKDDRGDMIRVIVEDDDDKHVIITVIRLDRDDNCSCS
jgi:Domain of unknown function (DUF4258)